MSAPAAHERISTANELAANELAASDPNEMPAEFDPRFDVEKPRRSDHVNEERYDNVPTDIEGLKQLCGTCWIDSSRIAIGSKSKALGEGAFGAVQRGTFKADDGSDKAVAVKRLKEQIFEETDLKDFVLEAAVLAKIKHPCIVEMYGVGSTGTSLSDVSSFFIASELMDGGDLKQLLYRQMETPYRKLYRDQDVLRWCLQIARGLRYLHESRPMVIHRDLKPENILLLGKDPAHMDAKIADFGLHVLVSRPVDAVAAVAFKKIATKRNIRRGETSTPATRTPSQSSPPAGAGQRPNLNSSATTARLWSPSLDRFAIQRISNVGLDGKEHAYKLTGMTGSLLYMAPEVFKQEEYDEKVDVYSFGMIMYELFMRELTFYAAKCRDQIADIPNYVERIAVDGERPMLPERIPEAIARLIRRCWSDNVVERPAMSEVVEELKSYMESNAVPQKASQESTAFHNPNSAQCCTIS